jgi:hypothetical protein
MPAPKRSLIDAISHAWALMHNQPLPQCLAPPVMPVNTKDAVRKRKSRWKAMRYPP